MKQQILQGQLDKIEGAWREVERLKTEVEAAWKSNSDAFDEFVLHRTQAQQRLEDTLREVFDAAGT